MSRVFSSLHLTIEKFNHMFAHVGPRFRDGIETFNHMFAHVIVQVDPNYDSHEVYLQAVLKVSGCQQTVVLGRGVFEFLISW